MVHQEEVRIRNRTVVEVLPDHPAAVHHAEVHVEDQRVLQAEKAQVNRPVTVNRQDRGRQKLSAIFLHSLFLNHKRKINHIKYFTRVQ